MLPGHPATCYPDLLGERLAATRVINKAVAATGCALPSFCLDEMLPPISAEGGRPHSEVLILEFALNDAMSFTTQEPSRESVDGESVDPRMAMERLLRLIRRTRPRAVPVLLILCPPVYEALLRRANASVTCAHIWDDLAELYQVRTATVDAASASKIQYDKFGNHPDRVGHQLLASTAAEAVVRELHRQSTKPRFPAAAAKRVALPPPRYLDAALEDIDVAWHCAFCDWSGCERVAVAASRGFRVHALPQDFDANSKRAGHYEKYGFAATESQSELAFALSGGRRGVRVLVALLCSHAAVGNATITLRRPGGGGDVLDTRRAALQWAQMSTQQCLYRVATGESGPFRLDVTVDAVDPAAAHGADAGGTTPVKVFGYYWQDIG